VFTAQYGLGIQVICRPNGLAMAQAIGRRPLMMDAAFNSK